MRYLLLPSPLGPLLAVAADDGLRSLAFDAHPAPAWTEAPADPVLAATATQLTAWFAGERRDFDLPLSPQGTDFQRRVWAILREIPFGETAAYGQIARRLDVPGGSRAVGLANGKNPLPILVPCHRVVGSAGQLTGFSGGLHRKRWLLDFERGPRLFG